MAAPQQKPALQVSAKAARAAQQQDLGTLLDAFVVQRKSSLTGGYRDTRHRIYRFEAGLISQPDIEAPMAIRFDQITGVRQYAVRRYVNYVYHYTYFNCRMALANDLSIEFEGEYEEEGLVAPSTLALLFKRESKKRYLGDPRLHEFGREVDELVSRARQPGALEALARGESLTFGGIVISAAGLQVGKGHMPWPSIQTIAVNNGVVEVRQAGTRQANFSVPAGDIWNLPLLLTLTEALRRGVPSPGPRPATSPGEKPEKPRSDSQGMATLLHPGGLSPVLQVPAHIVRPEYVGKAAPTLGEPDIKDAETIAAMRAAGQLAAGVLEEVGRHVAPGVTTDFLDKAGHEFICDHGAYPSLLGYRGYPKSLCTSLNEVICNGLPGDTVVADGDIINIHVTVYIGGVHCATNAMYLAGELDPESELLVERTREAMHRGIKAVVPGRPLRTVGLVIEKYAQRFGYGVVRDFTGHGIGKTFHSGLVVPHFDDSRNTVIMEPGMTFTIEPMLTLGTVSHDILEDGWTVVTRDRKRTAQFEHTILVTEDGHEILTLTDGPSLGSASAGRSAPGPMP